MARNPPRPPFRRWLASRRFEIVDRSMEPVLRPGDRVLVDRGAYRARPPTVGEMVAAVDPASPSRWLVKRVGGVGPGVATLPVPGLPAGDVGLQVPVPPGTVYLLSEAAEVGRDSRSFGPIPKALLRGRVWYRYAPSPRRGPL